jgi:tRNA threonylcarbamoyladenosine biosynthesis protein TsaE
MSWQAYLADAAASDQLGAQLARTMPAPAVVFLRGELGAGKSSLARALLRGLGVSGPIKSPTYTLVERYPLDGGEALHLDLYRIAEAAELEFLGLEELVGQARLWLVEWPERGGRSLPAPDLEAELQVAGSGRRIELRACSDPGRAWLAGLSKIAGPGASA